MHEHSSSVFGEMSALAVATGSVNLGQGFPDTDGPDMVKDAAIRAIREGRGNQYPPVHGVPELRRAIAEHQRRFYGIEIDARTDVVVAPGAAAGTGTMASTAASSWLITITAELPNTRALAAA